MPASATEGLPELDIFSNVFGNLPKIPDHYIRRPKLETSIIERLEDRNHPIITLHGRGGIGKTSTALRLSHDFSQRDNAPFEHIIWLSARDLELKPSGVKDVRRAVSDLDNICKLLEGLLGLDSSRDNFSALLNNPSVVNSKGILFIFDNFETLDEPREIHRFLDTHTCLPNKVLITSRERAFKGDYPIEVEGMEYNEAKELLKRESVDIGIENIVNDSVIDEIYEYTEGHAYIMRILLGEIHKEGKRIPLKSLVPRRASLLNVVFERSFNKLSESGRWVFLCIANWRSAIPELALLAVLGLRDLDVEKGIEECERFSLIDRNEMADGNFFYSAPELARIFGKKKLEGDHDRLVITEDIEQLREFIPLRPDKMMNISMDNFVQNFIDKSKSKIYDLSTKKREKLGGILTHIAELWPNAWVGVASFRKHINAENEDIDYAYRMAVEENPGNKDVWIARAEFALSQKDDATHIASLVSAVEADPTDVELLNDVALSLCRYIDNHKQDIPLARRGVYLASVREHMAKIDHKLDATGLSRLAWLYLLENDPNKAGKFAKKGLELDPNSYHCKNILEKTTT